MAHFLLAWELGGGRGHLGNLQVAAHALHEAGHQLSFAVRNPLLATTMELAKWGRVLPAPGLTKASAPAGFRALSFSDILCTQGWGSGPSLRALLRLWDDLFGLVRPDALIGEFSPTACLAARGRIPTLSFGNGFCTPPATMELFPPLRKQGGPLVEPAKLLDGVSTLAKARGGPAMESLPAAVAGDAQLVRCLPLFDPYGKWRSEPTGGPIEAPPPLRPVPSESRVFAYLNCAGEEGDHILRGLAESGLAGQLFARSGASQAHERLAGSAIEVLERPADLSAALPGAGLVLSHASLGLAQAALLAGRPQLVFTGDLEKTLIGRAMQGIGVARSFVRPESSDQVRDALRAFESDDGPSKAALGFAQSYAQRACVDAETALLAAASALL